MPRLSGRRRIHFLVIVLSLATVGVLSACSALGPIGASPTATATLPPIPTDLPTATFVPATPTPVISANCQDALGERGRILDRNGVVLAYSVADPTSPGGWRRHYTFPSLSPVIGYFSPIYGVTGLEKYYDQVLSGQSEQDCGADVYLNIDTRIQTKVDQVFQNDQHSTQICDGTETGSIIVEDPRTGQILAMESRPYFNADTIGDMTPAKDNPNTTVGAEYWQSLLNDKCSILLNRALQGRYPPGSDFKTLTLIAGLDSGAFTPSSTFTQAEASSVTVDGYLINVNNLEYHYTVEPPTFPIDLAHAYAYSDNVVFARVGLQVGADVLTAYAERFALSTPSNVQPVPIDTDPGSTSPSYLYTSGALDPLPLAETSYGQGQLFLTPLTMEMITSAVAANGMLYAPRLTAKIVPHDGDPKSVPTNAPVFLGQMMSPQTAQYVRKAMHDVVRFGSVQAQGTIAAPVYNSPDDIGGKTGTAETTGAHPDAWFISLAPDDDYAGETGPARLAITVMKDQSTEGAYESFLLPALYDYALPLEP
jgi:cell division protein FtsI/penicillin-binding protein 2